MLETIEIDPAGEPAGTVIWLHGLGADGHDFEPIVQVLELSAAVRFVFPHAPKRPVAINGGMEMRAWYDIDPRAPLAGTQDIEVSAELVEELVQAEEARGIPRNSIVLAGFSQGGVIAMHLGLRSPDRFAPASSRCRPTSTTMNTSASKSASPASMCRFSWRTGRWIP